MYKAEQQRLAIEVLWQNMQGVDLKTKISVSYGIALIS